MCEETAQDGARAGKVARLTPNIERMKSFLQLPILTASCVSWIENECVDQVVVVVEQEGGTISTGMLSKVEGSVVTSVLLLNGGSLVCWLSSVGDEEE